MATVNPFMTAAPMSLENVPTELQPDVQNLNRQQMMAALLMQKGQETPQGQMIGGHYVAPAATQNLAQLANAALGAYGLYSGDKEQLALAQKLRERNVADIEKYFDLQHGKAGTADRYEIKPNEFAPRDDEGNLQPQVGKLLSKGAEAVAADPAAAMRFALASNNPLLKQQAIEMMKTQKLGEGESMLRFNFATGKYEPIAGGGTKLPTDFKEAAIAYNLPLDSSLWTPQQRQMVAQYGMQTKRAGATQVSVPVYTQKAYAQEFGGLVAKDDMSKYQAAQSAPKQIQQANQIEGLLKSGAITGVGADFQLQIAKGLNLGGAENKDKIRQTELLASRLGQQVLDNVRASGLGAGQGFTDKDRQFLEKVVGGTITLDKSTLLELARIQKQTANASMNIWNTRYKQMPQEVVKPMGLQPIYTPMGTANTGNLFNEADAIVSGQQR